MRCAAFLMAGCVFLCSMAIAQTKEMSAGKDQKDNAALQAMYDADQSARSGKTIDWSKLGPEDAKRRTEVHRMLEAGEVRTANDYWHAAMVFQHGQAADDYLLAHVLAVDAISLGSKDARWLSAATLDRYLLAIKQPQIYGTQFRSPGNGPLAQETLNPSLVSDSMRAILCVEAKAEQQKMVDDVNHGGEFRSTSIDDCK